MYISDKLLDELIAEDVPYLDLTTHVMGFGEKQGYIEYFTREPAVVCGTEEAVRILKKLGIVPQQMLSSGTKAQPGQVLLSATGSASSLHTAWKVCQNILDHCSGIATKTNKLVTLVQNVNSQVSVVTTRKGFPGTKALSTKAVITGGAFPHRLGLSETVLIFRQHINFIGGFEEFLKDLPALKHKVCEKKLIVEAETPQQAIALCKAGADGIQFDKTPPKELTETASLLRSLNPHIVLLAAGGINQTNAAEYALTGVNALVTTNLYSTEPIDIGVRITNA